VRSCRLTELHERLETLRYGEGSEAPEQIEVPLDGLFPQLHEHQSPSPR
jgi:hypothetical protein